MTLNILPHLIKRKMTQSALADQIGIRKGFMSEIISGKKVPSLETLNSIAKALDVPVGALFLDGTTLPAPPKDEQGMAEDARPFVHEPDQQGDSIRAPYALRARNAAITHRAAINLPGFDICAGDLIICDLARTPEYGEVAIAVAVDDATGTSVTLIRRYAPPFLLGGGGLSAQAERMDNTGAEVRHPVIGVIRGT